MRRQLLNEGLSRLLWRAMTLEPAISTIDKNKFTLSHAYKQSRDKELNRMYPFYLSFARSLDSRYFQRLGTNFNIKWDIVAFFKLDGRKLGYRYKGIQAAFDEFSWKTSYQRSISNLTDEMEDRIISDKPVIPHASKYIDEIRVSVPNDVGYGLDVWGQLEFLHNRAISRGIPIKFYDGFSKLKRNSPSPHTVEMLKWKGKPFKPDYTEDKEVMQISEFFEELTLILTKSRIPTSLRTKYLKYPHLASEIEEFLHLATGEYKNTEAYTSVAPILRIINKLPGKSTPHYELYALIKKKLRQ